MTLQFRSERPVSWATTLCEEEGEGVDAESWDCWNTAPRPRPAPWGPAAGKAVQPRPRGTGTGFLGPCIDQPRVQTVAGTESCPRGRHLSSAEIPLP